MNRFVFAGAVSAAALLGSTAIANAASVEVMHWWTSGGEQAAVTVFAEEFEALESGHTWIDTAIAGGDASRSATLQRILGGDAPGAAQFNISRQFEELAEAGLLLDLTDLAEAEGWRDFIRPDAILDVCEFDGRIYCVPVNIHSWQWGWASTEVFENAGVEVPTNLEDFVSAIPAIQESGAIPFAIGGEPWQHAGALGVVLFSVIGVDGHLRIYRDRDADFARGPEVARALEIWREMTANIDDGAANRNWNDTTNLVLTNQAAMQIMGDWARGEFALAGLEAGVDYECLPGPSDDPYLDTGGDIFLFPKQNDAEVEAAQLEMASMMVNPRVQALFNNAKGSLPVRDDVDFSLADACMLKGLEILSNPDRVFQGSSFYWTQDDVGRTEDLWTEFSFNRDITIEEAQERFANIIATAAE